MAFTLDDLNRLEAAIATGARKVTYRDGRSVEYTTLADMLTARTLIKSALSDTTTRRPVILAERLR